MRTRRFAAVQMIVEARFFLLLRNGNLARAHVIHLRNDIEHVLAADSAHKRAEIFSVLFHLAGNGKIWKFFFRMYFDVRVRLVVFE